VLVAGIQCTGGNWQWEVKKMESLISTFLGALIMATLTLAVPPPGKSFTGEIMV
jgi:hypothetical protein